MDALKGTGGLPFPAVAVGQAAASRTDRADAQHPGRIAMIKTKVREPQFVLPDQPETDNLPEPVALTPEQIAAQAEAVERDRQRKLEWDRTIQALRDNAMPVFRAMGRFRDESEQEYVERVLASFEDGRFLVDRLGAAGVVDQDLAVVELRRRLVNEYGEAPATVMLIDRAVSAYQDFIVETFERCGAPRAPPSPDTGVRTAMP
jgi:hypothetical protein